MNDSAREIAERLERTLGADVAHRITVGTSHRLANTLLRGCAGRFARHGRYSIWDTDQTRRALAQALAGHEARDRVCDRGQGAGHATAPSVCWSPGRPPSPGPRTTRAAWAGLLAYEHAKRASAAFDFDDLLLYAAVALESDLALRPTLGRRWRHVLLDEVQDTNHAQYRIVSPDGRPSTAT